MPQNRSTTARLKGTSCRSLGRSLEDRRRSQPAIRAVTQKVTDGFFIQKLDLTLCDLTLTSQVSLERS